MGKDDGFAVPSVPSSKSKKTDEMEDIDIDPDLEALLDSAVELPAFDLKSLQKVNY